MVSKQVKAWSGQQFSARVGTQACQIQAMAISEVQRQAQGLYGLKWAPTEDGPAGMKGGIGRGCCMATGC